nr:acylphosphatase [Bradyrhizobium lablabi]
MLRSLQRAGIDLDAEGTLDSLWLALRMQERAPPAHTGASPLESTTTSGTAPAVGADVRSSDAEQRRDSLPALMGKSARTGQSAGPPGPAAPSRAIALPRATALPESRSLINALRPLRRRVPSPGTAVIDIETTVQRAAEEDLWIPSFEPARERWLDLLLVADHGLSMVIWKETIDEFERVLRHSGAFRSVRSWWLESDAARVAVNPRGRAPSPATAERLTRLVRGQARSIVVVISDCVGPRWHDGEVPRLLAKWASELPVALTQVTPEWFWARTALGDTISCRFRSVTPAAVNRRFQLDGLPTGLDDLSLADPQLFRLPAAPLTAAAMGRIAGLIAGASREWAPGAMFDLTWQGEEVAAPAVSASERATRFRTLASREAQRLAACFAASPVRTLGVLRLLRRDLLPEAGPFIEAEVLLGGILRVQKENARWDLGASLPLEFYPDVQTLLLDNAAAADVLRALAHAARVAQSGVVPTFTSWLEDPSAGVAQLDPGQSEFAKAAAASLARLGGSFARLVKPGEITSTDATSLEAAAQTTVVDSPTAAPDEAAPSSQPAASPQATDQPERREYLISGRVQGVGFRAFVQQHLSELGLEGAVENLRDGRVHVTAAGPMAQLDQLEPWLRKGPPASKVDDLVVRRGDDVGKEIDAPPRSTSQRAASPRGGARAVIAIGVNRVDSLPSLRGAAFAAQRFARWSTENQGIPYERVWLFTDDEKRVSVDEIYRAIASCIQSNDLDQLIVYFAGHGAAYGPGQDMWLLSDALSNANAVINVSQNVQQARESGIPHVVFISDTSREIGGATLRRVTGSFIFPNASELTRVRSSVDCFFAARVGQKAYELDGEAVFTSVLLSALSGIESSALTEYDGLQVVTSRSLYRFLQKAVPERLAQFAISAQQTPHMSVESLDDTWLASFPRSEPPTA